MSDDLAWEPHGTLLPNATRVHIDSVHGVATRHTFGVYLWPNGYVTVYPSKDHNQGYIYAPHKISRIDFGYPPGVGTNKEET
jgi:hypothetical protein